MKRARFFLLTAAAIPALVAFSSVPATVPAAQSDMTFFLTSRGPGDGANLGGLDGADAHCAMLAEAAGAARRPHLARLPEHHRRRRGEREGPHRRRTLA